MQQAIPYKCWSFFDTNNNNKPLNLNLSPSTHNSGVPNQETPKGSSRNMGNLLSENAIIVLARRGCCMGHVMKRLLLGLGVNPPVYEIEEVDEARVLSELEMIVKTDKRFGSSFERKVQFPAVFIGGGLFGGLDRLMASHISGELVPILREAGALWL